MNFTIISAWLLDETTFKFSMNRNERSFDRITSLDKGTQPFVVCDG